MPSNADSTDAPKPDAPKPRRDVRVDRIGLVKELVDRFQKPLADKVKADMALGERIEGDLFDGLLAGSVETTVDAEKFVRLYEAKKLTRGEFVSALKISTSRAKELLAEKDMIRITTVCPGSNSLRVTRRKGVQIELVAAVKELSGAVAAPAVLGDAA